MTILEIARLLARLLGKDIEPHVTLTGRKFDIRHNTADITRARDALGFQPKVTLEQGFGELIEWAKSDTRHRRRLLRPRAAGTAATRDFSCRALPPGDAEASVRDAAYAALCAAVFLTTFFYRFESLGGSLGGFSNDEFGYLARARQIQGRRSAVSATSTIPAGF